MQKKDLRNKTISMNESDSLISISFTVKHFVRRTQNSVKHI